MSITETWVSEINPSQFESIQLIIISVYKKKDLYIVILRFLLFLVSNRVLIELYLRLYKVQFSNNLKDKVIYIYIYI